MRKAGLNIMMTMKGDGKPVSFIEDCAVPLEHLAEYTDALTEVFAQARHARHVVRARVGRHAARAADPRHARATAPRRCARSPRRRARWCASTRARIAASTATACARRMDRVAVRAALDARVRARSRTLFDPNGLMNPGKIVGRRRWTTARCSASRRGYRTHRARRPALDWSAWNVQNDPVHRGDRRAPGTRRRPAGGFAKAVEMCNNNGHCRKFDAGTMCPSYRVTRDEQHLTRGRANTLRLALSGQLGADALTSRGGARGARPVRRLQGLQARMPDRRRHGEDEDRVPAPATRRVHGYTLKRPADRAPAALRAVAQPRRRGSLNLRDRVPGAGARSRERWLGFSARRRLPTLARATPSARRRADARPREPRRRAAPPRKTSCCSSTPSTTTSSPRTRAPRCACCRPPATACTRSREARRRPLCCGRTYLAAGLVDEAQAEGAARCSPRCCRTSSAASPIVGLEPSCLLTLRDEILALGLGDDGARRVAAHALLFEEFLAREARRRAASRSPLAAAAATRDAAARPLPPEGVRRGRAGRSTVLRLVPGADVDADRVDLLRHGRQLRLRGRALRRVDADGRAERCCPRCAQRAATR